MPHQTILLPYCTILCPIRHTLESLPPYRRLPRKMHSPSLLAGGDQLVQVVHIGDLARRLAATAYFQVFWIPCISGLYRHQRAHW